MLVTPKVVLDFSPMLELLRELQRKPVQLRAERYRSMAEDLDRHVTMMGDAITRIWDKMVEDVGVWEYPNESFDRFTANFEASRQMTKTHRSMEKRRTSALKTLKKGLSSVAMDALDGYSTTTLQAIVPLLKTHGQDELLDRIPLAIGERILNKGGASSSLRLLPIDCWRIANESADSHIQTTEAELHMEGYRLLPGQLTRVTELTEKEEGAMSRKENSTLSSERLKRRSRPDRGVIKRRRMTISLAGGSAEENEEVQEEEDEGGEVRGGVKARVREKKPEKHAKEQSGMMMPAGDVNEEGGDRATERMRAEGPTNEAEAENTVMANQGSGGVETAKNDHSTHLNQNGSSLTNASVDVEIGLSAAETIATQVDDAKRRREPTAAATSKPMTTTMQDRNFEMDSKTEEVPAMPTVVAKEKVRPH